MPHHAIHTDAAPAAIGTYSQAIRAGDTVYLSGQIALDPATGQLIEGDFTAHAHRVFNNLRAILQAANGDLSNCVKLTVYLTDFANFPLLNAVMGEYFQAPFPARATVGVESLPRGVGLEIDAIAIIPVVR